jgi:ribosome-associated protein
MPDPIFVAGGALVPADAMEMRAMRSSGPGGQNVDKVSSKVELRVDLGRIRGIDAHARRRLIRLVGKRLDGWGRLIVTSQRTRDQQRNLEDARRKVHNWVAKALVPVKKRIVTRPTTGAQERRLQAKRIRSQRKLERRRLAADAEA